MIEDEIQRRKKRNESFQKVPPKPRGLTGNVVVSASAPHSSPQLSEPQFQQPVYQQPHFPLPPWGAPYAPIVFHPSMLDSPMKRALGMPASTGPNRAQDLGDIPLDGWLQELDTQTGTGGTAYQDLWASLSLHGYEVVQDIVHSPTNMLAEDAACNAVLARRLQAKARKYLGL